MATPAFNLTDYAFQKLTGAKPKLVKFYKEAGTFNAMPKGWILHVAVGNGSLYNYFNNGKPGSRKFSHLWVSKKGVIEQYGSLRFKSWAQAAGNDAYWSVETEGFPEEKLTASQIDALARIHKALRIMGGRELNKIINKSGEIGIGTHVMGGSAWGGHSCPGTIRANQRDDILARAAKMTHQIGIKR